MFVACFGGNTCSGTLSLKSGNTTIAPNAHYTITDEKETVVFTKLTRSALAQLKARGTLSATATALTPTGRSRRFRSSSTASCSKALDIAKSSPRSSFRKRRHEWISSKAEATHRSQFTNGSGLLGSSRCPCQHEGRSRPPDACETRSSPAAQLSWSKTFDGCSRISARTRFHDFAWRSSRPGCASLRARSRARTHVNGPLQPPSVSPEAERACRPASGGWLPPRHR